MLRMDHFDTSHLTAAQFRARAEFIRETAQAMDAGEVRQQLVDLAEEYERVAEGFGPRRINDAA